MRRVMNADECSIVCQQLAMSGYTGVFTQQEVGANNVAAGANPARIGISYLSSREMIGKIDAGGWRTLAKHKSVDVPRGITIDPHDITARIDALQGRPSRAGVIDRRKAKSRVRSGGRSNEQGRANQAGQNLVTQQCSQAASAKGIDSPPEWLGRRDA
jgi:hypothetical protein